MTEIDHVRDPLPKTGRRRDWPAISAVFGALVVVALLVAVYFLFRPRTMTIRIDGPPGTRFLGNVNVDQRTTLVTGVVPAELKFRGRHLAFNVIPNSGSNEEFSVTLGNKSQTAEFGAGGWFDAREIQPDISLRPLSEGEWTELRNVYRRQQISGVAAQ